MENYVKTKKACAILGVHYLTLYNWEKAGKIDTIRTAGGHRMYNVNKYLQKQNVDVLEETKSDMNESDSIKDDKINVCYVRVSTLSQKEDLVRQRQYMEEKYPECEIVEDIGSGINLNRRGLRKIIYLAIAGKIGKVVIAYKDRLTRFGYELIEDLIKKYSGGEIIVDSTTKEKEPEQELVEDVLQIMNVYTAKLNGLRKYKKKKGVENN